MTAARRRDPERGAWDKDSLGVRALVGRVDEKSLRGVLQQVGRHQAFENLAVFEAETDPEAFGARTRREGLARERLGFAELADKIDSLDLAEVYQDHRARRVEHLDLALIDKLRGRDISRDGIAVHLADNDFFVR